MKRIIIALALIIICNTSNAQTLCPGGGTNFASSVVFNNSWISGCATGSSCTGGTEFDNRASCEPTTAMDACAPGPSCTTNSQDGSDIWFTFFAQSSTATINVIQNVSFVACIQAFSGGPTCGSLVEIGCAKAGGPSSGVVLNLTGLTVSQQYFFRVFGSASSASQRTGTYCFCGSVGLGSTVLPVTLSQFSVNDNGRNAELKWSTVSETNNLHFEIEKSIDGISFSKLAIVRGSTNSTSLKNYSYIDKGLAPGTYFYRLKQVDLNGRYTYSKIITVKIKSDGSLFIFPVPATDQVVIESVKILQADLYNSGGQLIKTIFLKQGKNFLQVSQFPPGIYWLKSKEENVTLKLVISR